MSNRSCPKTDHDQPITYQIKIEGHLGLQWTDWFEGLTITFDENDETLLTGPAIDQAALYGLLKKIRDLGMFLISVNRVEPGPAVEPGNNQIDINEIHQNRSTKE